MLICWLSGCLLVLFAWLIVGCWVSISQARWRRWPAGQLDPAPPQGCSCDGSMTKSWPNSANMQICKYTRPAGHPRRRVPTKLLKNLGSLELHFGPFWPILASLSSIFVHLGPNLAQISPNLAQLGCNLAQLWSQLGAAWPQKSGQD